MDLDLEQVITIEQIIEINKLLTGHGDILDENGLKSIYASYFYEDTLLKQIASVYRSVVKNHAFRDGNKRTGTKVLYNFIKLSFGIKIKDDDLVNLALDVAEHNYSIEKIANKIEEIM